jgi:hypothetical protein
VNPATAWSGRGESNSLWNTGNVPSHLAAPANSWVDSAVHRFIVSSPSRNQGTQVPHMTSYNLIAALAFCCRVPESCTQPYTDPNGGSHSGICTLCGHIQLLNYTDIMNGASGWVYTNTLSRCIQKESNPLPPGKSRVVSIGRMDAWWTLTRPLRMFYANQAVDPEGLAPSVSRVRAGCFSVKLWIHWSGRMGSNHRHLVSETNVTTS